MEKVLVTQSSMPTYEEYINEIKELWDSKWLTNNGVKQRQLVEGLKEYLKVSNVTPFVNGHMALYTAIKLMDLKGEVITTPFTFASTTHAIVQNGLKPVFCDIKKDDYTIDTSKIEELINKNTSAIVAVHVYGNVCDVEKIEEIAKKYNLKVIYDAAHAFGVEYNGVSVGNFGDISMFSFHATKVFNTIEGGALTYNNDDYVNKLDKMKNFGIEDYDIVNMVGMNCKMNEFQAAMGICNLRHIAEEIAKRKQVYERYMDNLRNIKGLKLNEYANNIKPNYSYFPVIFEDDFGISRDKVMAELEKYNIYARKYFYPIASEFDCYKDSFDSDETPVAKDTSQRVLTLPMYADLSLVEVDRICDIIKSM